MLLFLTGPPLGCLPAPRAGPSCVSPPGWAESRARAAPCMKRHRATAGSRRAQPAANSRQRCQPLSTAAQVYYLAEFPTDDVMEAACPDYEPPGGFPSRRPGQPGGSGASAGGWVSPLAAVCRRAPREPSGAGVFGAARRTGSGRMCARLASRNAIHLNLNPAPSACTCGRAVDPPPHHSPRPAAPVCAPPPQKARRRGGGGHAAGARRGAAPGAIPNAGGRRVRCRIPSRYPHP
jgi:hypothetical protein